MQALLFLLALVTGAMATPSASARTTRHSHRHHRQGHHRANPRPAKPKVFQSAPCIAGYPPGPTAEDPSVVAAAHQDARKLIASFNPPPHAVAVNDRSARVGGGAPGCPATPNLASFYDLWTVKGDMQSVIASIRSHPPRGGTPSDNAQSGQCPPPGEAGACHITSESVAFTCPPMPGVSSQRMLWVSAAPFASHKVGLRVVSQVVWLSPRAASEKVPAGVSSVSVVVTTASGTTSGPYAVSDPSKIDQIVALTDALPPAQPGVQACPADYGGAVRVTFKAADGSVLAEADAEPGGCGDVTFSIRGQPQPVLSGAQSYIQQLEPIVGFTMSSPTP